MTDKPKRDPRLWEDLGNGLFLRRLKPPLMPQEEAEFYGKGELKAFTRRPRPKDNQPPTTED
jgi:hypothetical protein